MSQPNEMTAQAALETLLLQMQQTIELIRQQQSELPKQKEEELPVILSAMDVRKILGISRSPVYELFKDPTFPALELNGRKLVYRDAFFQWLDKKQRMAVQ